MIPVTKLNRQYGLFIDGAWRPSADGKTFDSFCPATGDKLASCAEATSQDVDAAVDAAWKAFATWKKTTVKERATLLNKIADIIDAHTDELALIETLDNGKPIRETKNIDVPLSAAHFRYFAGCILAEEGSATMLDNTTMSIILREPIGVVGQIVPWNFPFLMAAWKLAPVLASGCCTVLKPSKTTSLSVLYFADLIKDILPPGVFNVITGAGSKAGQYMLDHKGFCKLAFTGSTEVGLSVAKAAAEKLIPATLELGGKSANIFFADCNLEQAYDGAQLGILFNQGQVCCAGSRLFVQEGIFDEFLKRLKATFEAVKIGDPTDPSTQLGAQIYKSQQDKVLNYVKIGIEEGATLVTGGKRYTKTAATRATSWNRPSLSPTNRTAACARKRSSDRSS